MDKLKQREVTIVYRKHCPFSQAALDTLDFLKLNYNPVEEKSDPELVQHVREKYHRTFPAIFVNGRLLGGYDDLQMSIKSGRLNKLLNRKQDDIKI
ncbi:glutaredoxin 3 [Vairimorpha ceranae]|uniref:Glutaredoxin 3 n=1 Tax=Vairimorpha ceranae TaxID=40302 RepID=A0A0F9WGY5_9MICR|nr:glutaredoxin 3 [Vairimorpha ceranae]KKO76561.1 glutaredoxin 3 [Vairimorpha ceranae]